jgi:hypothetical protein
LYRATFANVVIVSSVTRYTLMSGAPFTNELVRSATPDGAKRHAPSF